MQRKPLAQAKGQTPQQFLEKLGIPWNIATQHGADKLTLAQLRGANLPERMKLLKGIGIDPKMVLVPAFRTRPIADFRKRVKMIENGKRIAPGAVARKPKRQVVEPKGEIGKRVYMVLKEGTKITDVMNLPKENGEKLNIYEQGRIRDMVLQGIRMRSKGSDLEMERLMREKGFSEDAISRHLGKNKVKPLERW